MKGKIPTIGQLNECDVIVSAYHEYTQPWLRAAYRQEQWKRLKPQVIARFDESMDRGDLFLPRRMEELLDWADVYSFPAAQDAEKYGGQWLPYGSDTHMFNRNRTGESVFPGKKYNVAFIGSLYAGRKAYLDQLAPSLADGVEIQCGNSLVYELGIPNGLASMELLAKNYREIKIFFCLPPLSRLIVQKLWT